MSFKNDFNLFIGGSIGSFKGLKVSDNGIITKNLQSLQYLTKDQEVTAMSWGDSTETDILIATANQTVKVYDSEFKAYSNSVETKIGEGPIVGITRFNGFITTCVKSGQIKVWRYKQPDQIELNTNGLVDRMKASDDLSGIVATGGKENDLKLWNIETKEQLFCARNVSKDFLRLDVPVWVSDIVFLPESTTKLMVSTRHGHVRLYDTKCQHRPVMNIELPTQALNTLSLCCKDQQVVTGSGTGHVMRLDLRQKRVVKTYRGGVGSIRNVACSPRLPYVASVGLDRHLRVHHLETGNLLNQVYLKVKLNCVLMRSTFGETVQECVNNLTEQKLKEVHEKTDSMEDSGEDDLDEVFAHMETVQSKKRPSNGLKLGIKRQKPG